MEDVRITVRAKPGASRTRVGGSYGDADQLIVAVNAPAVDGRANDAIVKALADALNVPRRDVSIVGGHTGRSKVVSIVTSDGAALRQRVTDLLHAR